MAISVEFLPNWFRETELEKAMKILIIKKENQIQVCQIQ